MGFLSNLKNKISDITEKILSGPTPMDEVIRQNQQMLDAQLKLSKESEEGILEFSEYGQKESPALKDALVGTSDSLKSIEDNRKEMIANIESGYIKPIEELAEEWRALQKIIKEKEHAEKVLAKAKESLVKKKQKPAEKLKPGEIEEAEQHISDSENNLEQKTSDMETAEKNLEINKKKKVGNSLGILMKERKTFHRNSLSILSESQKYVDNISVDTEATKYTAGINQNKPKESSIFQEFTDNLLNYGNGLKKVIKEVGELFQAYDKLAKESEEGIQAYRKFAEQEDPALKETLEAFAGGLEIIETNRKGFAEQMRFEILEPLDKLLEKWKILQNVLKEGDKAEKTKTKAERHLEKVKLKPTEKLDPDEIPTAEKQLEDAINQYELKNQEVIQNTEEFNREKANVLKEGLGSLIERNHAFHEQALNIIESAEKMLNNM